MSTSNRLTEVFESATEIPFDDSSKLILFSDCHRGDNSWSDDFAHNQNLFFYALEYYYKEGFTYIEVGDGDELWENKNFQDVKQAHSHAFWKMREFYTAGRLHLIWGNHDIVDKKRKNVGKDYDKFYNAREQKKEPLFEGIEAHEGLILRHSGTDNKIFVVHGHQGDFICDLHWRLGTFFVRHGWKHLQLLGVKDRTSPAKNNAKRENVEKEITKWIEANNQMVICGHTHRPWFPAEGKAPYFNTGSCTHPRCITGIEIQEGKIALIKWWVRPRDDGTLYVEREELEGRKELQAFF